MPRGGAAVTFQIAVKPREKRIQKNFRVSESIDRYLKTAAKSRADGGQTEVLEESIALNRDLSERLGPSWTRIQTFAREVGLDLSHTLDDLPEVLARLVELGLGAADRERKPPRR